MEVLKNALSYLLNVVSTNRAKVGGSVVTLLIVYRLSEWAKILYLSRLLRKVVRKRLEAREKQIGILELRLANSEENVKEERNRIRKLNFNELIEELQNNRVTAVAVLEAYQEKALVAHADTNCVHQFIQEAHEWAAELDRKGADKNWEKPPLFGIPFSVKENVPTKDYESPYGFALRLLIGGKNKQDSTAVHVFRKLGAVPFCITNMPQSGLSWGSSNPIYGVTVNPHDKRCGPGGSSSGEGALIGSGGSILGLGSDVGGSIRIPAHLCGVTGLKPSSMRVSQRFQSEFTHGRTYPRSTWGPMARDVDTLITTMRHVYGDVMFDADPMIAPLPFNEDLFGGSKKLTIGYYTYNGHMPAVPACERAVEMTKSILERNGHKLVQFEVPRLQECIPLMVAAILMDGGKKLGMGLHYDLKDPNHYRYSALRLFGLNHQIRNLFLKLPLKYLYPRLGSCISRIPGSTTEAVKVLEEIDVYRNDFVSEWDKLGLDAIICPAHACTAVPYDLPPTMFLAATYCALYNLMDMTAGVLPVTRVTDQDDDALMQYQADDQVTRVIKSHCQGRTGMPVGVQVVTMPFRDEICLRVMKEVEAEIIDQF